MTIIAEIRSAQGKMPPSGTQMCDRPCNGIIKVEAEQNRIRVLALSECRSLTPRNIFLQPAYLRIALITGCFFSIGKPFEVFN